MKFIRLTFVLSLFILLGSCSKTDTTPADIEVQNFIWKGLNAYYLWQGEIADLSDRRFSSDQQLNSYLQGFSNPSDLFESLLYRRGEVDRFSWIVDDYIALEQSFDGVRLTSGMKLKGALDSSGAYFVYVRDVVDGSNADTQGVKRGMIITEVNGTRLTQENVSGLFANTSFTIHLADFNAGNVVTNSTTIDLTKTEAPENSVKIAKIIPHSSGKKIGYLMYNQFSSAYDKQLNAAFADFKNGEVSDLIIDLRYNGGGSVKTATYLGSMITGYSSDKIFSKQMWNSKVQENTDPDNFVYNFTNQILNKDSGGNVILNEPINSLGLTSVYFIVTNSSASASELIINALKPYIDVKLVGEQTYGKHVGSITLYDSDSFTKTGGNLSTNHTWAMQPIVLEIQNKNGENKPEGFTPDKIFAENPENLGVLGEVTEPLLERTIQYLTTGLRGVSTNGNTNKVNNSWDSMMTYPDYNNMYIELK